MNKLIINTANDTLEIVLKLKDKFFSSYIKTKAHHNETMLSTLDALLRSQGVEISEIDEFGVVIGPGSFTGIRVGISTIKAFRDALNATARGINNLDYLFSLAKSQNSDIETVAIKGSHDSYFVAKFINGIVYKFEHNLTLDELNSVAQGKKIGMFASDEKVNCFVVGLDEKILFDCLEKSSDFDLVPAYYQLSQAEREKMKKQEVLIVEATTNDAKKIAEIESESITVNTLSEEAILSSINDKNHLSIVAKINGEIVGFLLSTKTDEINIESVAVKKEFRNFGIATKLINRLEDLAKKNNIASLSLEVKYDNITAYLLYSKLGFTLRRVRKNYYQDGQDCLEMVKKI